jgi:hypothetical protein
MSAVISDMYEHTRWLSAYVQASKVCRQLNDACNCKIEMLKLHWYITDMINDLPNFGAVEDAHRQQRFIDVLTKERNA